MDNPTSILPAKVSFERHRPGLLSPTVYKLQKLMKKSFIFVRVSVKKESNARFLGSVPKHLERMELFAAPWS